MTKEEAKQILYNFYKLLNNYADGACLLNVGAEYNELSELIIECQKEFSMPGPILGAKISENISENIWNMLIDEKLFSMGQPTFYGVNSCINALEEKGISHDIAKEFSKNVLYLAHSFNSFFNLLFFIHKTAITDTKNKMLIRKTVVNLLFFIFIPPSSNRPYHR